MSNRRIRILHTLPDLAMGGGQVITLRHLTHRDRERFDVDVVVLGQPLELLDAFNDTGVAVHHLSPRGNRAARVLDLARLLRRERVDLLHVHGPLDRKLGLAAAWLARVPAVCQIHSEYVHLGPKPPPGASLVQRRRAVIAAGLRDRIESSTVRAYIADSEAAAALFRPIVSQPVTAMELSLPFDAYARAADIDREAVRASLGLAGRQVLLNVSRLAEGKGQERLITMLSAIRRHQPDALLVLVGDGPERANLEQLARACAVGGNVRFLGNRHDVATLLRIADVFVFASRTEGLGVAVAEAMGAGLPVVAFRLPALDTYCEDGVTGFYPEQTNDSGFVDAVDRLLVNPGLAAAMGAAGHGAVAQRFHARATADCFEATYCRALGLPVPGPAAPTLLPLGEPSPLVHPKG